MTAAVHSQHLILPMQASSPYQAPSIPAVAFPLARPCGRKRTGSSQTTESECSQASCRQLLSDIYQQVEICATWNANVLLGRGRWQSWTGYCCQTMMRTNTVVRCTMLKYSCMDMV